MERRGRRRKSYAEANDPFLYLASVPEDASMAEIMRRFYEIDMKVMKGEDPEQAAKETFVEFARPEEYASTDLYLEAADYGSKKDKPIQETSEKDEDFDIDNYSYENYELDSDDEDDIYWKYLGKKTHTSRKMDPFSKMYKIERLGGQIERWPINKFDMASQRSLQIQPFIDNKGKRSIDIMDTSERIELQKAGQYFQFENISNSLTVVLKIFTKSEVDAYLLDPPFGENFGADDFSDLLEAITGGGGLPLYAVWVDPDNVEMVKDCCQNAGLELSESIAVELFDELLDPVQWKTKSGLPQSSRMVFIFREQKMKRDQIKQQGMMDVVWGTVYPNGKSGGRYGMPSVIHEVFEKMLPPRRAVTGGLIERTFVEFWPSKFGIRPGWIHIDEAFGTDY